MKSTRPSRVPHDGVCLVRTGGFAFGGRLRGCRLLTDRLRLKNTKNLKGGNRNPFIFKRLSKRSKDSALTTGTTAFFFPGVQGLGSVLPRKPLDRGAQALSLYAAPSRKYTPRVPSWTLSKPCLKNKRQRLSDSLADSSNNGHRSNIGQYHTRRRRGRTNI